MTINDPYSLSFGPFIMEFPHRVLLRQGVPVRLGSRALDVLVVLLDSAGELVSRDFLLSKVWPVTVVDEGALRVHLSAVRKALGEGLEPVQYISNEPGRGYRFIVPVTRTAAGVDAGATRLVAPGFSLPGQITKVLGRDEIIMRLGHEFDEHRLLTITGAGGIGKTTVALAVAHRFVREGRGRACFVDFAPLSDPGWVIGALAAALGITQAGADPLQQVVAALGDEPVLLLMDNCEHLIDAVAPIVERLLRDSPSVRLLVTCREPLRAEGEWLHRLMPLPTPARLTPKAVGAEDEFPAIRLFVERATAVRSDFLLNDDNWESVCEICRQLDGLPLAIEFAAARVDWLDVAVIASHLGQRFKILTKGRRTALPRHQTLRATLDWSYDLLSGNAQAVLRRIAMFRTSFDMKAMSEVARCPFIDAFDIYDIAADLVAKSLLTCDTSGVEAQFRLLDTTRYYGIEKLEENPEQFLIKRQHALFCNSLFSGPQEAWEGNAKRQARVLHSQRIEDIRAALDWAFSESGDPAVGIDLLVVSSFLWFELSIPNDFLKVGQRALTAIARTELKDSALHVELLNAYGHAEWHAKGPGHGMRNAFETALQIAESLEDQPLILRSVWGIWMQRLLSGEYGQSLEYADRFFTMAKELGIAGTISSAKNMLALSHHWHGNSDVARLLMDEVIEHDSDPARSTHANAAQVDGHLSAVGHQVLFMWLQGDVSRALDIARAIGEESLALDHDLTLCAVFSISVIPVCVFSGELELAQTFAKAIRERAQRRGMRYWDIWGEGYLALLTGASMDLKDVSLLQVETFAAMGMPDALKELMQRGRNEVRSWVQPELLRRYAESHEEPHGEQAVAALERALEISRTHRSRSIELRVGLSLAKVRAARGDGDSAKAGLARLLKHFADAPHQPDVAAASSFLSSCA